MKALTEEQVAAWRRDGFLFSFPMLSDAERQDCLDGLARYERFVVKPLTEAEDLRWRTMPYIILPWAARLARDPRILDVVEDLLGPDLLVWTSTFFIKEPGTPTVAAWHQDVTYYGIEPAEEITVWLALTEASREAGCMEVLSADGRPRQMHHAAHVVENSINRAGQVIVEPLDESRPVAMALPAGSFSLHDGLCPHRSAPNRAGHRRVGLGFNYIRASTRPAGAFRTAAMLVRGTDHWNHFEPVAPPAAELDAAGLAAHERAVTLYRQTYQEQEPLHVRKFATAAE